LSDAELVGGARHRPDISPTLANILRVAAGKDHVAARYSQATPVGVRPNHSQHAALVLRELFVTQEAIAVDPRVTELHCIMPVANIASVLTAGILSYERTAKLPHLSVAMQPVQDRRDQIRVPGGKKLHQYANLYFDARNPMMYKRRNEAPSLCVLRVSTLVLKVAGAVITDCNAASDYVRFLAPSQWRYLNFDDIYAPDWRHKNNPPRYYQHRSRKCAEVLVPDLVHPRFLQGAYVPGTKTSRELSGTGFTLPVDIKPILFFR
jgi:hypothetical protein